MINPRLSTHEVAGSAILGGNPMTSIPVALEHSRAVVHCILYCVVAQEPGEYFFFFFGVWVWVVVTEVG